MNVEDDIDPNVYLRSIAYTFIAVVIAFLHEPMFLLASSDMKQGLRARIQVKNALTLTNYSGYDPEISTGGVLDTGIDRGTYPQPRIWSLGLNIKF